MEIEGRDWMSEDWLQRAREDPAEFRRRLLVRTSVGDTLLEDCVQPWQDADFRACDPGWIQAVLGERIEGVKHYVYLERGRGHSKTKDIAIMASWALFAAGRHVEGVVGATDKEQAGFVRDAIQILCEENPWLAGFLTIKNWEVTNKFTGSRIRILATDAAGNFGHLIDFLIVDELTHWTKGENWDALFSTVAKRAWCQCVVISNAGMGEGISWQWTIRERARVGQAWVFSRIEGIQAPWITEEALAEQRAILPNSAYKRLWLNQWTRGEGDALEAEDVYAAITLKGPINEPLEGFSYIAGLDLGITRDHSSMVIVGAKPGYPKVHVAQVHNWRPPGDGREIDMSQIEAAIRDAWRVFELTGLFYDPNECRYLSQKIRASGLRMEEVTFTGKNLVNMASAVLQGFREHRVELYPDDLLVNDLLRLVIVEKSYGYRLEATRDEHGHADRATALAIVLPVALEISGMADWIDDGLGDRLVGQY